MIVEYENASLTLDLDEITVEEARTFKRYANLTLKGLEEGLKEGDADAMTCLYWLMLRQSGQEHNIEKVSFKIVKLAEAIQDAQLVEAARRALAEDTLSTPKDESEPVSL